MALLGMELSDVGIMIAGGEPAKLIEVDGRDKESPGFALTENDHLIVGKDAQEKAHLNPRLYTNHFWDELNTEILKQPGLEGKNNAELAYMHLSMIWDTVKRHGDELVIAVPGFFTQRQLGLILGIANELSIPVKGFAATAIAASSKPYPNHRLFHLDIHLHRIEITFLEQSEHLIHKNVETLSGKGISYLYSEWVKAVADEFVRTTRFDPFDQAIYEQELYMRLPQVLIELQVNSSVMFEMKAGSRSYRMTLTHDLFAGKCEAVFREVRQLIEEMAVKYGKTEMPLALEITHRVSTLPGFREEINKIANIEIIELEAGSSAFGVLTLQDRFAMQTASQGVTLLTSRPWQKIDPLKDCSNGTSQEDPIHPTHILYKNLAYPISAKPLIIGQETENDISICINDQVAGVNRKHCTIQKSGDDVLLVDNSSSGTFIDGVEVSGTAVLRLGQTIRIGTPGEELCLIACVGTDET
ncbi:MAG: FHA domain-containing protein [Deltaproteobacteria bacterium]|jgi:hypothetical protein|nr:FHA domain-containing protein [Deltaproteobacteria bacterium]MCK5423245.1 FHA domain-containing protein [Deltaproteobacteria bacterium]